MFKSLFDFALAFCLLLISWPLFFLVGIIVFVCMGEGVIFKQPRSGLKGKPFHIYKFRTMTNKKNSDGCLLADEQRLTTCGKWLRKSSLDELPQLINVLRGDISFVGPRPLLMEYLPLYNKQQRRRLDVKPGITGWAQVNGRNAISWEEKFELDIWYVDHQSTGLDLKILWLTFIMCLQRDGVSAGGHATMPKFRGSSGVNNE